jgi:hypothetical protein
MTISVNIIKLNACSVLVSDLKPSFQEKFGRSILETLYDFNLGKNRGTFAV